MEVVIGLVIAVVMAALVMMDARSLQEEEITVFGVSSVSPGLWATGVFLVAMFFLPAYAFTRISHNKRLADAKMASRPTIGSVVPVSASLADEIAKAHALLSEGAITQAEFDAIKSRVLR